MIANQRHLFDLPDEVAYLNCAYMSPLMTRVVEAGLQGVRRKARPWQITPRDFFTGSEAVRALFARLVGASADDVAIVPAASYGIAVAARNLPLARNRTIVVLAEQFPSNVYAWREAARAAGAELVTVGRPADGDWTRPTLAAITGRTAVAALPHCHWTDGGLLDLVEIGARCREVGAALVVDLTQSAGALPFDVGRIRPDYAVASSYKWLLGPYSLGFLYVAPKWQQGTPLEYNWIAREGSEDFAGLVDYRDGYQPGARRFDVGERSNFQLLPMAEAALGQLLDWGVEAIAATLAQKTAAIAERARSLGLTSVAQPLRAGHYLGLRFPGGLPAGLAERLAAGQVFVSVRGNSLRVTPHLYNTDGDVEKLFAVFEAML